MNLGQMKFCGVKKYKFEITVPEHIIFQPNMGMCKCQTEVEALSKFNFKIFRRKII